jgi:GDP-L-fucose synthase
MNTYSSSEIINVGWGKDISIAELAQLISEVVGFQGRLEFDLSKPEGTPRKLLDTSRLTALGWQPTIALDAGIASTYDWYCANA